MMPSRASFLRSVPTMVQGEWPVWVAHNIWSRAVE